MPEEIARIGLENRREIYNILFQATSETLRTIAADPKHLGAEIGFLAVHVLPNGFMRIRHYGLLSNPVRDQKLELSRRLLETAEPAEPIESLRLVRDEQSDPDSPNLCPSCKQGRLLPVETIPAFSQAVLVTDTSLGLNNINERIKNWTKNGRRFDPKPKQRSNGYLCFCTAFTSSTACLLIHYERAKAIKTKMRISILSVNVHISIAEYVSRAPRGIHLTEIGRE